MTSRKRVIAAVAVACLVLVTGWTLWSLATGRVPAVDALLVGLLLALLVVLGYVTRLVRGTRARVARTHRFLGRHERRESRDRHRVADLDDRLEGIADSLAHLRAEIDLLARAAVQDRAEFVCAVESVATDVAALREQTEGVHHTLTGVADRVAGVEEHTHGIPRSLVDVGAAMATVEELVTGAQAPDERLRRSQAEFAQLEALLELRALLPASAPVPASRGWAAAPTTLMELVTTVLDRRPDVVVECGSGASSVWVGLALRQLGSGRCISLEHDPAFAEQTRRALRRHGLDDVVEVRDAPLVDVALGDETFAWYAPAAFEDLEDVGVVFVDGPPASTGPLSRYPAVPLLAPHAAHDLFVVLDDAARPDEREIVSRWLAADAVMVGSSRAEKGWATLSLHRR